MTTALYHSEVIGAVPAVLASAESLYNKLVKEPQLVDWSVSREAYSRSPVFVRAGLDVLARSEVNTGLHIARVLSGAFLLVAPRNWTVRRGIANVISGLASAAVAPRERYGSDGADQATAVVQLSNSVGRLSPSAVGRDAAIWNVSIQSTLSYAAAGYIKITGAPWRDGTAVTSILRTRAYGHEGIWAFLSRRPRVGRALTYLVLAFECTFPVVYVLPAPAARLLSLAALFFHVANGYAMGLWRFVFAFASMHPQLLATTGPHPQRPAPVVPVAFAAATIIAFAASIVASASRRRRVVSAQLHLVSSGNSLDLHAVAGDPGKPLVVFENGLLGLPEHYSWIRSFLEREGYGTVTYSRAGYGASLLTRADRAHSLDDLAEDLASVVEASRGDHSSIVLVGHSIGGEIVRRLAARADSPARISGAVYLDPTHPNQLAISAAQFGTVKDFSDNLLSFHWSTLLSLGTFLTPPPWVRTLPPTAQTSALDQYRDHRLWEAGHREWRSMRRELQSGQEVTDNHHVDALLVTAGRTLSGDPSIDDLHLDIIGGHQRGRRLARRVVIDDVTHDSMLTNPSHARKTADAMLAFLEEMTKRRPDPPSARTGADGMSA